MTAPIFPAEFVVPAVEGIKTTIDVVHQQNAIVEIEQPGLPRVVMVIEKRYSRPVDVRTCSTHELIRNAAFNSNMVLCEDEPAFVDATANNSAIGIIKSRRNGAFMQGLATPMSDVSARVTRFKEETGTEISPGALMYLEMMIPAAFMIEKYSLAGAAPKLAEIYKPRYSAKVGGDQKVEEMARTVIERAKQSLENSTGEIEMVFELNQLVKERVMQAALAKYIQEHPDEKQILVSCSTEHNRGLFATILDAQFRTPIEVEAFGWYLEYLKNL